MQVINQKNSVSLHELNAMRSSLSTRLSLSSPTADAADPTPVEEVRRRIGRASAVDLGKTNNNE